MSIKETLQNEIQESKRWVDTAEGVYKRDLIKRIELINWVLEQIKNPDTNICAVIESKINEIIDEINKKDSIIERDPLDSELRILDWILYQVCSNEIKRLYF
jgi:3-deoxy-D-arabino-heptulosonate 7-phosphate (DAHP) synthase